MSHDEIIELLGAFALDAVGPGEAAAVREHLATCPRCRDEVTQHQQVAGILAASGGEASPTVWDGIAARLAVPGPGTRVPPRIAPRPTGTSPGPTNGRGRSRLGLRIGALVAAAAAAAIAVLGVEVDHLDHRLNQVAAAAAAPSLANAARTALLDPQSRRVVLRNPGPGSQVLAEVVTGSSGSAYLFNRGLPVLPVARSYQLWALTGNRAVSLGVLGTDPGIVAFTFAPAALTGAFAVTVEPPQGSITPTLPPAATGTV
jgi:anti-sigma factor RsiW